MLADMPQMMHVNTGDSSEFRSFRMVRAEFRIFQSLTAQVRSLIVMPVYTVFAIIICLQEQISQVLDAMFEKTVSTGEHIIDQDDDGDNFYVIERCGSYDFCCTSNI